MAQSDVRDIESLKDLHRAVVHLSERLELEGQQLRAVLRSVQRHFGQNYPAYWRSELRRAEREYSEARDRVVRKQSTTRAGERHPATEERKQAARWKQRVRFCYERQALTKRVAVEMEQECEKAEGPIADILELAEVTLPNAATRLASLIDRLSAYQQGSAGPSPSPTNGDPDSSSKSESGDEGT